MILRRMRPEKVSRRTADSAASAHTDTLGTGGIFVTSVTALKLLLLITLSRVSAVVVATLVREPDALESTLTTIVAVVLAPAARLVNVHVISVPPVHNPAVAMAEIRDVPSESLSLIWTLVAAVEVLLLVTVMT